MKNKTIVLGYGVSGQAAGRLLQRFGKEFIPLDRKQTMGALPDREDFPLDEVDQLVLSPGISPHHPIVQRAKELGIEVTSEIELSFRSIRNRCVGITGTNGKTTVTLLVTHLLNESKIKARALGNVGEPLADAVGQVKEEEVLVVELSSFQLEMLRSKHLNVAAFLNLTPDHLDRYATMRDYAAAKANIQKLVIPGGQFFVAKEVFDEYSDLFLKEPLDFLPKARLESNLEAIRKGCPEAENEIAAYLLASHFGEIKKDIKPFQKPKHRIEWVAEIDEVIYLDDSKGTNIDAVMYALNLLPKNVVLIAGGVDKGASYAPWKEALKQKVKHLVAYGNAAAKMELELKECVPFLRKEKFADAVRLAKGLARRGDIVLLSPGCSSFDQFQNYAERGNVFQQIVREVM